jgi:uncharacterized protein YjbJ (UPF0337 family)
MNSDQLKGKWKQMKGSVKERWGKLTDDDLDVIDGQEDQLIGTIQERLLQRIARLEWISRVAFRAARSSHEGGHLAQRR